MAKRKARAKARTVGQTRTGLPDPISLTEAATLAGVNERTIRRYADAGRLKSVRKDGRLWLERSEISELASGPGPRTGGLGQGSLLMGMVKELREEKRVLTASMLQLAERFGDTQRLLTDGEASRSRELTQVREQQARELSDKNLELASVRDRAVRAETAKRWILILAGVLGAGVVALAVVLVGKG